MKTLPEGSRVSPAGHLVVGGCDVVDIAREFGTPVVAIDRNAFEARARAYASVLGPSQVFYAAKAFCCVAVCELVDRLDLGLDVCTGGELRTARAAGFPGERMVLHGNNKSPEELRAARHAGVGRVVIDSFEEIERIREVGLRTRLLVRIAPGVEAHTHEFVQTGREDSKFGFGLSDGRALEAIKAARNIFGCEVIGVHAHIGSQILELAPFDVTATRLASFAEVVGRELGIELSEVNLGGGLGIAHTKDETAPDPRAFAGQMLGVVQHAFTSTGLQAPRLAVEPGRSIVGPACVTVYTVGTVKTIPGVRTYVSVDGGMSDNIRPALYGARYEAFLANRVEAIPGAPMTVAGKHCESGDVLASDVPLPADVRAGDLLCIPATGAYTYAMAGNYNRVPRPVVVLVEDGNAVEITRRETEEDLLRLDRHLDGTPLGPPVLSYNDTS